MNSVLRLALGMARRGVHVRFVCPPGSPVEAEARQGELEVQALPLARHHRFHNAAELRALLERAPVDLIDSHGSRDREAWTWLGLAGRLKVPVVFTRRSWPRTMRLESWLAGRVASRVVAISAPVAEELARRGTPRAKLRVIQNGVLLDRIDREVTDGERATWRERLGPLPPGRPTLAVVARPKDLWVVLRALAHIRTPVRLVLSGLDGEALIGALPPIPERHLVVRLPFLPDIRPLYDLVDLVLHPSRWDALPQAVLEAMALGKPVIASEAPGHAVIIRDRIDGWLVPPTDPAAWAEAVEALLGEPPAAERLGLAARHRAREGFPFARTLEQTLALYREVLGR